MERYASLIGRVLLCAIFLMSGMGKITDPAGTQAYMASHHMPYTAVLLVGAILLELGGGLSLLLGLKARWGALALVVFLVPTTLIFHTNFAERLQVIQFMKNLAILGGLLTLAAFGPGPISLDAMLRRAEKNRQPACASHRTEQGIGSGRL